MLFVVLIGHGTDDGVDARFNLVGPDLSAAEWRRLLDALPGRTVFVNTTASSLPFVRRLARDGRVVIAATAAPAQRYDTVFPRFFVEAVGATGSDADKDGRVSVWEAFVSASAQVRRWYQQEGRLATERAVLDDSGDGIGGDADRPGDDGGTRGQPVLRGRAWSVVRRWTIPSSARSSRGGRRSRPRSRRCGSARTRFRRRSMPGSWSGCWWSWPGYRGSCGGPRPTDTGRGSEPWSAHTAARR